MKISCLQKDLALGVDIVSRAIATRTTLPITQNILLAAEGGRFKLATTNLELAITCWLEVDIEEEAAITIPAKLFSQFVSLLPPEKVGLSLPPKSNILELHCGRFEAKFNGMEAADFPPIPKVAKGVAVELDPQALQLAISQVVFAAATEDTRPVLTGVHCHFKEDTLTLAAADGFRLSVHKLLLGKPVDREVAVIIPAKTLQEIARLLEGQKDMVKLVVDPEKGQCRFDLNAPYQIETVSQLIQGTFPNYAQLIPASYTTRMVVGRAEFLKAIRTVSVFARDGGILRLVITPGEELTPGKLLLSARSEELGENVGQLDTQVIGEAVKIAFNSKYLTEVVSAIREEQIALETTSPTSPGVIRPVGNENFVHVIMPLFVQW